MRGRALAARSEHAGAGARPGRCCSRASRTCGWRRARCWRPRWCWSGSPTPPSCRRRRSWCRRARATGPQHAARPDRPARCPRSRRARARPMRRNGTGAAGVGAGNFAEAVALFERFGEPMLHGWLYQAAQLVHFEPGRIELRLGAGTPAGSARPGRRGARALDRAALAGQRRRRTSSRRRRHWPNRRRPRERARIDALAEDPRIKPILRAVSRGRRSSTCARPRRAEHRSPITEQP